MSEALRLAEACIARLTADLDDTARELSIRSKHNMALDAEVKRLHAEAEALRADAERYRWLREHGRIGFSGAPHWNVSVSFYSVDSDLQTLDKNIDAALKEST